jgi:hypothetical protein
VCHGLTSFFHDRFPKLKLIILEVGAGWISYRLDRMDAVYDSIVGRTVQLKERPSFYFKRNVWISADPDEHSLPAMVELRGADKFFWASDFPHADHTGNYMEELEELADTGGCFSVIPASPHSWNCFREHGVIADPSFDTQPFVLRTETTLDRTTYSDCISASVAISALGASPSIAMIL